MSVRARRPKENALDETAKQKASSTQLQTLDRGLQALALIAQAEFGMTIIELAERLGIHRTIVYRIAATLERHGLIARNPKGVLHLGAGIVPLAARFESHLREMAQPMLDRLAERTGAAAFLSVPEGADCVAILVAEPRNTLLRIAYRIGSRHPLTRGAAGIAILAGRTERSDDPASVRLARRDGVSVTRGELQAGALGVACPVGSRSGFEGCLGVVTLGEADIPSLSAAVEATAEELRELLRA